MNRNITALILIILAIGIYFTLTSKMITEVKAIQAVNAEYASAKESAEKLIKVRDQVLKDYNELTQDDRDRLEKMIPSTVDNIRLIIDLRDNLASRHNLTLKNIKATASNDTSKQSASAASAVRRTANNPQVIATPTLDTVNVSFNVEASYSQFINFMRDLERNLRIMDIKSLSLVSDEDGTYNFTVELVTYWLRQ